jgi:aldose 1-epimerase
MENEIDEAKSVSFFSQSSPPDVSLPMLRFTWISLAVLAAPVFIHAAEMKREICAQSPEDGPVEMFTLVNAKSLRARVITWGATLVEMSVPDRLGKLADVTLGFDSCESYLKPHPFFGSITGRYANRIAKGKFTLDGKEYTLAVNSGPNHLHGGKRGFDKRNWKAEPDGTQTVKFTYVSPDGEEGYPGTLTTAVTYTLTDANELKIDYHATTDRPTVVNLTNHAYWNLAADGDVLGHELRLNCERYAVIDADTIPTGELRLVKGTPFDFTTAKPIGRDIAALKGEPAGGYDHNFVITSAKAGELVLAAEVHDPKSGRVMRVLTDQPGLQLYTANHFKSLRGEGGRTYEKHAALCLETQHYPDSPNQPDFPSTVLRPGEVYRTTTVHAFSVR